MLHPATKGLRTAHLRAHAMRFKTFVFFAFFLANSLHLFGAQRAPTKTFVSFVPSR
jgi:hypothetical protein